MGSVKMTVKKDGESFIAEVFDGEKLTDTWGCHELIVDEQTFDYLIEKPSEEVKDKMSECGKMVFNMINSINLAYKKGV